MADNTTNSSNNTSASGEATQKLIFYRHAQNLPLSTEQVDSNFKVIEDTYYSLKDLETKFTSFKSEAEKGFINLSADIKKVEDKFDSSFESFKKNVNENFNSVRDDIQSIRDDVSNIKSSVHENYSNLSEKINNNSNLINLNTSSISKLSGAFSKLNETLLPVIQKDDDGNQYINWSIVTKNVAGAFVGALTSEQAQALFDKMLDALSDEELRKLQNKLNTLTSQQDSSANTSDSVSTSSEASDSVSDSGETNNSATDSVSDGENTGEEG